MKNRGVLLFVLLVVMFSSFVNAEVISLNSGGTGNIIINPAEQIEGFFFCSPDTCSNLGYNCGTWSDTCGGTLELIIILVL